MALKGIAQISYVRYIDADTCQLECNYIAFGASNIEAAFTLNVEQSSTALAVSLALVTAFKDRLENVDSIEVGILDTVRIYGAGVIEA